MIPLPRGVADAEIAALCEAYAARLMAWLGGGAQPRCLYDGTVGSLCDVYERHPESPIREVRRVTAEGYLDSLKVIRATVAARAVRALAPIDVKRWHRGWRAPARDGGPERVKRAHDAVASLRMILNFGHSLGYGECGALAAGLSKIRFERAAPRSSSMTLAHARAFIAAALAPAHATGGRGLAMAIGVATQFETMLRQADVIGQWICDESGRESWAGPYRWDSIPGGVFRLKPSKTQRSSGAEVVHDLTRLELLWPLLQSTPQAERAGAIVKAFGQPVRARSYRKWFRAIAREAGVPDAVWSMDARAGAVTEALESGADFGQVQRAATHMSPAMTSRYDRERATAPRAVADARNKARRET